MRCRMRTGASRSTGGSRRASWTCSWCWGNTLARVQSELVISEGTAITHRRNIYRKLDVHSKQELLDFVERYARA